MTSCSFKNTLIRVVENYNSPLEKGGFYKIEWVEKNYEFPYPEGTTRAKVVDQPQTWFFEYEIVEKIPYKSIKDML